MGFPAQNFNSKTTDDESQAAGEDPYLSMLDHRNTPTQGLNKSPAQGLLSRRTRTLLPTRDSLLQPKVKHTTQQQTDRQMTQAKYFNRTAKDMDTLKKGDSVRIGPFEPTCSVVDPVHHSYVVSWTLEGFFGGINLTLDGIRAQYPVCQTEHWIININNATFIKQK